MQKVQLIEAILTVLHRSLSLAKTWSQNWNSLTLQRFAAIVSAKHQPEQSNNYNGKIHSNVTIRSLNNGKEVEYKKETGETA